MLKVLWYYKRPKINMLIGKVTTEKKQNENNNTVSVISGEGYHICNEAKIIPQNLYAI